MKMKKSRKIKKRPDEGASAAQKTLELRLKALKHRNALTLVSVLFVLLVMIASVAIITAVFSILGALDVFDDSQISVVPLSVIALLSSVVLGAGISAFISRFLLKPLNEVIGVMRIVSGGDFSVRATERTSRNPLYKLVHSFNMMIDELSGIEMFRRDFINTFSHEFKTPIVSIRGFARQLRDADLNPEQQRECVDIIISESERLSTMSSNILLLTKFESQSIVSGQTVFSLDEQIRRSLLLFEREWSDKKLDIEVELEDTDIYSNEEMLSHIWVNLLSNAIKFTPEGGKIGVELHSETIDDREYAVIRISDNGIGMDPVTLSHIFEKFYQGDSSHSLRGNGLGLSLVRRIVDLCDGELKVVSAPGTGSVFTVRIPKKSG